MKHSMNQRSPIATLLLAAVRAYQLTLGPLLGGACRYQPSCSEYAAEAIVRHGARRGGWLALQRIGRCHPWARFGYDPVPESMDGEPPAPNSRHAHAASCAHAAREEFSENRT